MKVRVSQVIAPENVDLDDVIEVVLENVLEKIVKRVKVSETVKFEISFGPATEPRLFEQGYKEVLAIAETREKRDQAIQLH